MSDKIVLLDGHSILNRAFYGVPDLSNAEGLHTNAVYGFLNILFKILDEEQPQYLAVAFDLHAPTFRHKMYDQYKGTRKPMPQELREQVPVIQEVLAAMDIEIVTKEGYEADDILGTLGRKCEEEGMEVTIVSGDRDLLQLATDHILIRKACDDDRKLPYGRGAGKIQSSPETDHRSESADGRYRRQYPGSAGCRRENRDENPAAVRDTGKCVCTFRGDQTEQGKRGDA